MTLQEYFEAVEELGVEIIGQMDDCSDYIGKTSDGRIIQVPDPVRMPSDEFRQAAYVFLKAKVLKWMN